MPDLAQITLSVPGFADPVSSWTHLVAAGGATTLGFTVLRSYRGVIAHLWGPLIFAASAVLLFAMSGTYHLLEHGGAGRHVMQRMDHAAIWLLIAGTFTGIHSIAFTDRFWRWGMIAIMWTLALTGLVLKTVLFNEMPEAVGTAFYLLLGWFGVATAWKLKRNGQHAALRLLMWGGVAYSVGAIVEAIGHPVVVAGIIGPHELFHVAVIIGVILHWRCIKSLLPAEG